MIKIKIKQFFLFFQKTLWRLDLTQLPKWKAVLFNALRIVLAVGRDVVDGQLNFRAMSLVYTTLLSLVPLLAVSFSVLKGFGVHNQIEPALLNLLAPLGDKGLEITDKIIEFVDNIKVGVMGAVGLGLLFYTVVALMQKIESAFNYTWHVQKNRPFSQRFSTYLSVVIVGPVLVFSALGITATVMSHSVVQQMAEIQPLGDLIRISTRLVPYLLIILAFTFVYSFIPNTKVKIKPALIGAFVAGILWQSTHWAFATFVVSSTQYTAIYSAFATLILFMIWLYLVWLILLVGSSIAFYCQNPTFLTIERQKLHLSARMKEQLALRIMYLIGKKYYANQQGWSATHLAEKLNMPMDRISQVLDALEENGLLTQNCDDEPIYLPSQPLDTTLVLDALKAVRSAGEGHLLSPKRLPEQPAISALLEQVESCRNSTFENYTLKDLALKNTSSKAIKKM
ncbi:MAG: YihY family inner membrane protein [Gammaproteobacteria bacterium]|nr:YihY family inner membrane protein [Gammaproteobacteria bacterium]